MLLHTLIHSVFQLFCRYRTQYKRQTKTLTSGEAHVTSNDELDGDVASSLSSTRRLIGGWVLTEINMLIDKIIFQSH